MEAQKCSRATDGKGYDFPAQRATSISVVVLLVTALAGAGEPAGRDPNSIAIVSAPQADSREGAAHKKAAKALLGQHYQDSLNDLRTVAGLSRPGPELTRQDAEAIIGHCQRALALGVKDAEVYWMMGAVYFLQKQYREAIGASLEALQIEPDSDAALHLLVRSHSREGEYETALDYCLRALAAHRRGLCYSYFYSLCRRLIAAGQYATVLSYYEKLTELSSRVEIDRSWPQYDLAKETSHVKYYLNSPIKGYPPTLAFPASPRFGRSEELSAEERQKLLAPLDGIALSCSSPNVTVTAVSLEKKGFLSQARIIREWGGAIEGDIGAFEVEFKGEWKERADRSGVFEPADLREEINQTKAAVAIAFLQQAAPHLGIPQYVLRHLRWSEDRRLTYSQELTYKGVPLRIYDMGGPRFSVSWDSRDAGGRNVFGIGGLAYRLPTADIPVEPLVTEQQARQIAAEALMKNRCPDVRQERSRRPADHLAGGEIPIGRVSLCIQPELLSLGDTSDMDLFDPACQFVEYRLLWFARDVMGFEQVKVDAITGETLAIRALVMSGPTDGGRGGEFAARGCPGRQRTTLW